MRDIQRRQRRLDAHGRLLVAFDLLGKHLALVRLGGEVPEKRPRSRSRRRRRHGIFTSRPRLVSADSPRRGRGLSPRTIHVAAAAAPSPLTLHVAASPRFVGATSRAAKGLDRLVVHQRLREAVVPAVVRLVHRRSEALPPEGQFYRQERVQRHRSKDEAAQLPQLEVDVEQHADRHRFPDGRADVPEARADLRGISAWRRRGPSARNIQVAAAASPRFTRGRSARRTCSTPYRMNVSQPAMPRSVTRTTSPIFFESAHCNDSEWR